MQNQIIYLKWKKSHWKAWGNGHLKITSLTILFKKHSFDNVRTFFLPEVHIKNIFRHHPYCYILGHKTTSNQLCV